MITLWRRARLTRFRDLAEHTARFENHKYLPNYFDYRRLSNYSVHAMNTHHIQSASEKESQLTLELLNAIDQNDDISQRHLAQQMGVALGLANSYLKRCVKKGLVKISTAPANRYLYYLTPSGFAEKARLTGEFFSTSLALFRQSGNEYSDIFKQCRKRGFGRVMLVGLSDLTEIALMRSMQSDVEVTAIYQSDAQVELFFGTPVINKLPKLTDSDCLVLTSMEQTADLIRSLENQVSNDKLLVPEMLLNMKYRNSGENNDATVD